MRLAFLRILAFTALALLSFTWIPVSHAAMPAKAALLYNLSTNKILYQRNQNASVAPASLTKIMTIFLTLDAVRSKKLGLNQKVRITAEAAKIGGSSMGLATGEQTPIVRLISGASVASGNDAATALAVKVGGSTKNFVRLMNRKAASLGMKNTVFKNPTGLPAPGQKTTALDLLALCKAYLKAYPQAARFHSMKFLMHKGAVLRNTNPLLGTVPGVTGLKTGWTIASGYNLIVTSQKGSTRLLAIVLGAPDKATRDALARRMIEAGNQFPNSPKKAAEFINSLGRPRSNSSTGKRR